MSTLEELIAREEGRAPDAPPAPVSTEATPPASTPAEAAAPAAPETPAAPVVPPPTTMPAAAASPDAPAEIDWAAVPDGLRETLQARLAAAADADRRAKQAEADAKQAAGQLKRVNRELALARKAAPALPSAPQTPAPALPATGNAPALSQPAATVDQAAALALLKGDQWKRLLRDYPEMEAIGTTLEAFGSELQSVRNSLSAGPDRALAARLDAMETAYRKQQETIERERFAAFEAKHNPAQHVHLKAARGADGEITYQVTPRSPQFAWFYLSLDEDIRASINWDDPNDVTALFDDMVAATSPAAPPDPAAPATPVAPVAPAAPPPNSRQRITVAAVPRAPNAGVMRVDPNGTGQMPTTQQQLAALIAAEEGRTV